MKKVTIHKSQLFYRYIVSYLALAFLPLIIIAGFQFREVESQILSDSEQTNEYALELASDSIDAVFEAFNETANAISTDRSISPYKLRSEISDVCSVIDRLKIYSLRNSMIDEIALYIHGDDKLYTDRGMIRISDYAQYRFKLNTEWDVGDLYQILNGNENGLIGGNRKLTWKNQADSRMLISQWGNNNGSGYGTIVGIISEKYFQNLIENIDGIIVAEYDGLSLAMSPKAMKYDNAVLDELMDQSKNGEVNYLTSNGKQYTVIKKETESGIQIYSIIDHDEITRDIQNSWYRIIDIYLIALAGAILLGIMFSYRAYRPIFELYKNATNSTMITQGGKNELTEIERHIEQMKEEYSIAEMKMHEMEEYEYNQLLVRLCFEAGNRDIVKELEEKEVKFIGPNFCAAVIDEGEHGISQNRDEIIRTIKNSQLSQISVVEMFAKGTMAILFRKLENKDDVMKHVSLLKCIVDEYSPNIRIGVGTVYEMPEMLAASVNEALAALEVSQDSISIYNTSMKGKQQDYITIIESLGMKMKKILCNGNENLIKTTIDDIGRELQSIKTDSRRLQYAKFTLIMQLCQIMTEVTGKKDDDVINSLLNSRNVDEFIEQMGSLCLELSRTWNEKNNQSIDEMYMRVLAFLEEHVYENSFSLNVLAQEFNVTDTYMSRFFHEHAGTGFIEYVTNARLKRAAELLVQSDMPIKQIMEKVGYVDQSSFTRKFAAIYGKTPGIYRKDTNVPT